MTLRSLRLASLAAALAIALAGCPGSHLPAEDGSVGEDADDHAGLVCVERSDCDDGTFCNGREDCSPGAAAADARGCVRAPACFPGQTCDEGLGACLSPCDVDSDVDGDGHDARECGGDDCDDADARRFPGNPEVCDAAGHDEDCDGATPGFRDQDGDGFGDAACCNAGAAGAPARCATDCDDLNRAVHPMQPEVCNAVDDNCDGDRFDGLACRPDETRPCVACGTLPGGTERCDPDRCVFGSCAPPPAGATLRYAGNDPRLAHDVPNVQPPRPCGVACGPQGEYWCAGAEHTAPNGNACHAQYGPYVALPEGRYAVTFGVAALDARVTATFDVATDTGAVVLPRATVVLEPGAAGQTVALTFANTIAPSCRAYEFRVRREPTSDPAGRLEIRSTTLLRAGD